ncbi:Probable alpha,alpha-trehalose-phosphate synthase [UDP-forming] 10 [Linum perenne]
MVSRSCTNFLDLVSGNLLDIPQTPRSLPKVMTVPGIISDVDGYGSNNDGDLENSSYINRERRIVVANMLPVNAKKDAETGKWCFCLDEDSLLLQLKDGFSPETEFVYVGSLKVDVDASEQEEVAQRLLEDFNCVPTFLPQELLKKFYLGFCKQQLWPLFHYMLPMCPDHGDRFDRSLWQAYVSANKMFADKVMEVINPDEDYVWVHDYHLMVLPTFLRKRYNRVKLGFFLHSPFPSSEIYRTLPVRDEILRGLLNCDLIGFHQHPDLQGRVVMVQIVNPARGLGKDVQEARRETYSTAKRINEIYGSPDYEPVVLIDRPVPRFEKSAYYALAECCIVNAVRDGMNLVPYKYIVCRQGTPFMNEALGIKPDSPRTSMIVVSEFVGCSPSLSGAIRVNPWDTDAVGDALSSAITMEESGKQLRHEKHYKYVSTHDVAYWARSFMQDLERACQDHYRKRCWSIGWGLGFRVVSLNPSFRRLGVDRILSAYKRTTRRAIFLDYDGTVVPDKSMVKNPESEVISVLKSLSSDPNNTVFIVSGRGRSPLSEWLEPCERLGIAAEHGYFIRWSKTSDWETCQVAVDLDWKKIVEPIMRQYTEATDGSSIEIKESALVWHYQYADPDFGSCQSKELLDHLENVLANEPVVVERGHHIVEVKPQGVSKGTVAEKVLNTMAENGNQADFVMCIGDDRSDEDMFESILSRISSPSFPTVPEIFACTVGQKPSKAKYFLDDAADVVKLLQGLVNGSCTKPKLSSPQQTLVSFESVV